MRLIILLSLFLLVLVSCGTKMVTYYDTDKTQIIGISNKIYADSNFECLGTFSHYSGSNTKVYEGIALELAFMKDTSVRIEELQVKIKPYNNGSDISPVSFVAYNMLELDQFEGKEFNSIRSIVNQSKDPTVTISFKDDVGKYDSLFLHVRILLLANDKHYEIKQNRIYLKGYFRKPFSR